MRQAYARSREPAVFVINLSAAQISRLMGHKKAVRFILRLSAICAITENSDPQ